MTNRDLRETTNRNLWIEASMRELLEMGEMTNVDHILHLKPEDGVLERERERLGVLGGGAGLSER